MAKVTHDNLPQAVEEIREIQIRILELLNQEQPKPVDKLMTIDELCEFLPEKPAKNTIYGKACKKTIPYEKHGSKLYFRTSTIKKWLDNGRCMDYL